MLYWRLANVYWCVLFTVLAVMVAKWEFLATANRSVAASRMLAFVILGIGALFILFIQLAWRYYLVGKQKKGQGAKNFPKNSNLV